MIAASGLVSLIIYIIIAGAICALLWWLVDFIGLPDPFRKIAKGVIAVVGVLFLINVLLSLMGTPLVRW